MRNFNWDTITIPMDEPHQKEDNLYLFVANEPISNFDLKGLSRYWCIIVCTPDEGPSAGTVAGFYASWVGSCPDDGKCCQEAGNVFCAAYNGAMDRNSYFIALYLAQFDYQRCIIKRTISGSR